MSEADSRGKVGGARPHQSENAARYARCAHCGRVYDEAFPHHCADQDRHDGGAAVETRDAPVAEGSRRAFLGLSLALAVLLLPIGLFLGWMLAAGKRAVPDTADLGQSAVRKPDRVEQSDARKSATDQLTVKQGQTFRECDLCPEMIVVPAGRFMMGSAEAEYGHDRTEWPQHEVTISQDFGVGKYEVTVREFVAFLNAAAGEGRFREGWVMTDPGDQGSSVVRAPEGTVVRFSSKDDRESYPVTFVSWMGALEYTRWLSRQTGGKYRLLSEAEWEFAARAGSTTAYHFGDDPAQLCDFANVADITGMKKHNWGSATKCEDGYAELAPVGRFQPNSFGLFDMLGNASEWVADCARQNYDKAPADGTPIDGRCDTRILRGGSYQNLYVGVRSAKRYASPIDERAGTIGFRVARTLPVPPVLLAPKAPEQRADERRVIEGIPTKARG